ncbi:MAG: bacillithiol biosynthesis BshC, partial [Anaerolineae bacterium]|nr:bacillithiol biosynthesis BshC [Anaerolineae bacterium]
RILRDGATDFFTYAIEKTNDVAHRLADVSQRLVVAGYKPWLTPAQSGRLFTLDRMGRRVRTDDSQEDLRRVREHPELYSTDAALRPLFADSMLPVIVSVLGPGETAYQAMLRPLYDLFDLPQPLLFPRKSYTIVAQSEAERLGRYGVAVADVLTERLEVDAVMRGLTQPEELEMFDSASRGLKAALSPLRSYVEDVDPTLGKSWAQTLARSQNDLDKLAARVARARLSRLGLSRGEVRALSNSLLPRGRLQERVFPLPHFLNRYGTELLEELLSAGRLDDFTHHVLTLEERDV